MFSKCLILIVLSLFGVTISQSSRRSYRRLPSAPLTYAQYPSYNIQEPNGPGTYAFGFEIQDPITGNVQFRDEERLANGTVQGSYGYVRPDGIITLTKYWADSRGYRSSTEAYHRVEQNPSPEPEPLDQSHHFIQNPQIDESYEQPSLSPEQVEQILHNDKIDSQPAYDQLNDPNVLDSAVGTLLGGKQQDQMQRKDGRERFAVQFVNNFIPSNYPILSIQTAARPQDPQAIESSQSDYGDSQTFVNDKFHDPVYDIRKINRNRQPNAYNDVRRKSPKPNIPNFSTKEALWFREMIRNRRKEYLQKYSANYDLFTIPANYETKSSAYGQRLVKY